MKIFSVLADYKPENDSPETRLFPRAFRDRYMAINAINEDVRKEFTEMTGDSATQFPREAFQELGDSFVWTVAEGVSLTYTIITQELED